MRLKATSVLLAVVLAAAARADTNGVPAVDLERLQLDPTAAGSLVIGNGEVGAAGSFRASFSIGYQKDPLVLLKDGTYRGRGLGASDDKAGSLVGKRFTTTLGISVAPVDRMELYLRVPAVAWQGGTDLVYPYAISKPTNNGMGTPSFGLRLGVVGQGEGAPVSIAVAADVFPAWGAEGAAAGNQSWAWAPRVEVGRRFAKFLVAGELYGYFRETTIPLRMGEVMGNEYGGGVAIASLGQLRGELSYRFAVNQYELSKSSELLAGCRYSRGPVELYALVGPGFGAAPGTPSFRALVGVALVPAAK